MVCGCNYIKGCGMPSPGVSLDNAIAGLNAGVEQARKVASQLAREGGEKPTAESTLKLPDPDSKVGTNVDEMA